MSNKTNFLKLAICAGLVASAAAMSGCEADGDPSEGGGITDGGDGSIFPNDGTTGGNITENGTPIAGGNTGYNFICETGALAYGPSPTTQVAANGLVGGLLSNLLTLLGGDSVANLLASVSDKDLVVDGKLHTAATFTVTAALLGPLLTSVDEVVTLNGTVPSGNYAVFGVSFPTNVLGLSLLNSVTVTTYQNDTEQESAVLNRSALDLLGQVSVGGVPRAFIGVKTTKPYNIATIGLEPAVAGVHVGEALNVHELCTGGRLVSAP